MISFLEGTLAEKSGDRVVIGVQGIGYEVLAPSATIAKLPPVGKPVKVYTRLHVRDDALTLYGFVSPDERALFDLLVTVNSVGPKVALAFLSVLTPDALRRAVGGGDVDALTIVPGVGKKVAQRVVLDLKDRLGGEVVVIEGPLADVREALLSLGLSPQEAGDAMAGLTPNGEGSTEDLLRRALRRVGRG
jgi:holliday junction DNA helicase RuvA